MKLRHELKLEIPPTATWLAVRDGDNSHLVMSGSVEIIIAGELACSLHVEAFEVTYTVGKREHCRKPDKDGRSLVWLGRDDEKTGQLFNAFGMDGYMETITINGIGKGKQYALFMSPFCK